MKRPRLLAPSRVLRETPQQAGGGWDRTALVELARQSIAEGSHSFAFASALFDRPTREKVWLFYAWCRRCDDLADGQQGGEPAGTRNDTRDRLKAIRVLTKRAFDGLPTADPAFDGMGLLVRECGISHDMVEEVIGGFALDERDWRPRTEGDMMRYCYHVAGAVGVIMARIMNIPRGDTEMLDCACDLGLAFQLSNIARDIVEDDAVGRCYLPVDWLAEMDLAPGQHAKPENRAALAQMAARLVDMMESHEAAARLGAAKLPFRQRWAVLSAARIYGAIGREVRARGADAWNRRVVIGPLAKLRHVVGAFFEALRNRPETPAEMPRWRREQLLPVKGW